MNTPIADKHVAELPATTIADAARLIEKREISSVELTRAYAQALLVDREALAALQQKNDVLMAAHLLKRAFTTDVSPILAEARRQKGAAIDPVAAYRASHYRASCAEKRPAQAGARRGIV